MPENWGAREKATKRANAHKKAGESFRALTGVQLAWIQGPRQEITKTFTPPRLLYLESFGEGVAAGIQRASRLPHDPFRATRRGCRCRRRRCCGGGRGRLQQRSHRSRESRRCGGGSRLSAEVVLFLFASPGQLGVRGATVLARCGCSRATRSQNALNRIAQGRGKRGGGGVEVGLHEVIFFNSKLSIFLARPCVADETLVLLPLHTIVVLVFPTCRIYTPTISQR